MARDYLLLERRIESDLETIESIYEASGFEAPRPESSEEELIVLGFRLHSLYSACENVFANIATTFENELDKTAGWHAELLERMRLDLSPARPALLDEPTFDKLDELRRFRHLFRAAYGARLDADRLALVHRKAVELRAPLRAALERFLTFLRDLRGPKEG